MTIIQRVLVLYVASFALPLWAQEKTVPSPAALSQEAVAPAEVLDSQQFLLNNIHSRGPAKDYSTAVEKLLSRMTPKEKIGQMTQLDISMVCDGKDQELKINPEKLKKVVGEYGVGSILNVFEEALPLEKWHEILGEIQAEAARHLKCEPTDTGCVDDDPTVGFRGRPHSQERSIASVTGT